MKPLKTDDVLSRRHGVTVRKRRHSMPNKLRSLLCVYTCHRYDYTSSTYADWFDRSVSVNRLSAIRDTWLKDVDIDYRVFFGRPPKGMDRTPLADEVFL